MKITVPIGHVREQLRDDDKIAYTDPQLLAWWNEAQRVIASLKPDTATNTEAVQLAANSTRQTLKAGRTQLLSVTRNMGANGSTPGRSIRLTDRGTLEDFNPTWHSMTGETTIKHYVYDPRTPREYWVFPRPHATTQVWIELVTSIVPADVTDITNGDITIGDEYEPAAVSWVLHRCLGRESRHGNLPHATHHLNSFNSMMGTRFRVQRAAQPTRREHLDAPGPPGKEDQAA